MGDAGKLVMLLSNEKSHHLGTIFSDILYFTEDPSELTAGNPCIHRCFLALTPRGARANDAICKH